MWYLTLNFTIISDIGFIYIKNSNGSKTEPWLTPVQGISGLDY